jgi:hypothetical protein
MNLYIDTSEKLEHHLTNGDFALATRVSYYDLPLVTVLPNNRVLPDDFYRDVEEMRVKVYSVYDDGSLHTYAVVPNTDNGLWFKLKYEGY